MRAGLRSVCAVLMAISALQLDSAAREQQPPGQQQPPWPDAATVAERKRDAERRRLFRSDELLPVTLKADFRAVMRDRNEDSVRTYPATISFPAADGSVLSMPLRIRTRGHSRRNVRTCTFAPLRLEFEKARTRGTVFDGHGALKLGTHCRAGQQEIILREHTIYRMFNLLTPRSFRSRVAKMTYLDEASGKLVAEESGLLIEDDDDVAKRLEGRIIAANPVFVTIEPASLNLMMLFEYMIGNTDFSILTQHNVRVVQTEAGRRFAVPYDFDYSGLADASYARPAPALPISTVRDRLFRGPCRTAAEWQPHVDQLREVKSKVMELFDAPGLSPSYRKDAKSYVEQFYRVLDQPSAFKRAIIDPCVKMGM
jgi:hypothetical protein